MVQYHSSRKREAGVRLGIYKQVYNLFTLLKPQFVSAPLLSTLETIYPASMFCEMHPVIESSVVKLTNSRWLIGSSTVCESDLDLPPSDALASWTSDEGKTFYIRESRYLQDLTAKDIKEWSERDRVHQAGTGAAMWAFGGIHVKAKAWVPELQAESDTIKYVRGKGVPVPEVVFSWVDAAWNRSFLIMKSIAGRTLYQAWSVLSQHQKSNIANQIASYCEELALSTSQRMETLSGNGVYEPWLTKKPSPHEPSWRPFVQGPFTAEQLQSYVQDASIVIEPDFRFYHADLGPTNIILDDLDQIAAVIDWESAAFYPPFWIATKPLFSAGFNLASPNRSEWAFLLSSKLEEKGFKAETDLYRSWRLAVEQTY